MLDALAMLASAIGGVLFGFIAAGQLECSAT